MHYLVGALVGYLAGVTTPGIIRRLRAEAKQGVTLAEGEVRAAQADLKADAQKVAKKL